MDSNVVNYLARRFGTRSISPEPLTDEQVQVLMEAARLTPSCFNNQPWRYLFLESAEARSKGTQALTPGNRQWAGRAPLLILGHSRKDHDCIQPGREYHQFDLGMSAMNLMLAATEMGLVARPMAGFDPKMARELFGLEDETEPLVMIAVGLPSDDEDHLPEYARGIGEKPRERKPAGEIIQRL